MNNTVFKRQLNPMHVWAIAFGCIIGWGSFVNPGKKFLPNSGVAGTAIAMVLGAIVMIILSFAYAYLVPKHPESGGEFLYAKRNYGVFAAYICGWFLLAAYLTNVPMNSTAIGLIVDGLFGPVLKWGFHYQIAGFDVWCGEVILAGLILIFFGYLNIIGVKKAGFVQTVLATLLVTSVFVLFVAALCSPYVKWENMLPWWGFDKNLAIAAGGYSDRFANASVLSAILATFAITPWAYVGFDTIPQASEEFKFRYNKVMLILVVAILFGCFVYTANNTIAAAALENWPDLIVHSDTTPWLLLAAAERMLGTFGKVLIGIAVSCAVLSGIMGFYLGSSRLMYSMGRDGYLPSVYGKLSRFGTPTNAMIFCIIISLAGPVLGREALGWFVDMSSIGASIGFLFACLCAAKEMKKRKDGNLFIYLMAVIGTVFSVIFILLQLVPISGLDGVHFCKESYIMFGIWTIIGLLFFYKQKPQMDKMKE